jgi:hypothetical protein
MIKLKMVVVEIDAPRWLKRSVLIALAGVMAFGVSAVVRADVNVKTDFQEGTVLTAKQLNDNFGALKVAVEALQKKRPVLTTSKGATYSLDAVFCGASPGLFNGKEVGSYQGAKKKCEETCGGSPTAHLCTTQEVMRSESVGVPITATVGWINNGIEINPGNSTIYINDCLRWSSEANTSGGFGWTANTGPTSIRCNESAQLICCD